MSEIIITLNSTGHQAVTVKTNLAPPKVGAPLSCADAMALDAINALKRSSHCSAVHYGAALGQTDGDHALQLANDLLDPEAYGHSVSPEVRNAARRVLGIKGREGLAA